MVDTYDMLSAQSNVVVPIVKRMTRQLFSREGADRRRDRMEMENIYYSAIYSVLQNTTPQKIQAVALTKLKAKIIRLNSRHNLGTGKLLEPARKS